MSYPRPFVPHYPQHPQLPEPERISQRNAIARSPPEVRAEILLDWNLYHDYHGYIYALLRWVFDWRTGVFHPQIKYGLTGNLQQRMSGYQKCGPLTLDVLLAHDLRQTHRLLSTLASARAASASNRSTARANTGTESISGVSGSQTCVPRLKKFCATPPSRLLAEGRLCTPEYESDMDSTYALDAVSIPFRKLLQPMLPPKSAYNLGSVV
ncbi:hypothetical protein R3P38DRAFT_2780642 [Favolaschia claudopus]|uniref:Uncharacterized protein n=1 Tax=Favolaschia claudopus TaxID=2862362 RepID=A0AAW0B9I5_9AGAR